jgi:transketolase
MSKRVRIKILSMAYKASAVHIGCAFSIVEILVVLYRTFVKPPYNSSLTYERDYLILSKGHGVMAQYACLNELGIISDQSIGSTLMGLSDSRVDGIEVTSGSLGHGLPIAVGIAFGLKLQKIKRNVYVIVGDGELNEGSMWEGFLFAAHHKLDNLVVIVDRNNLQAMGNTEDVIKLGKLKEKFRSFDFEALEVDGHIELEIEASIKKLIVSASEMPKVLIANTIKGKGVSFMENKNEWHYSRLNESSYQVALSEIMQNES